MTPLPVRVRAASRIHISLADMGFASLRAFGGVGFMLNRVAADVELEPAAATALVGADTLDTACQAEVETLLNTLAGAGGRHVQARVHAHAPQHVGLGTKTALKLAVITAHDKLFGTGSTRESQQRLSGRGGASGIGVHGFFEGGVLWDAGQPAATVSSLLPSSCGARAAPPLLMMRQRFPSAWRIVLCLPEAKLSHGADERLFFETQAPILRAEALETMALLHHGILPAFRLADLDLLAESLLRISQVGFKRREIERCGSAVSSFLGDLHAKGYAAGMSSMGPLVYVVIAGNDRASAADIAAIGTRHGAAWLGIHAGQNSGVTVRRTVAR
ncbi:hypothetical protein KZ810_07160 [Sphingomonas sp. RHCKR47]|uniref:beta-ribofuranosylaminobenzene 5'-phosphate synthase family protein n=1 Tax=Sphingomonas citricola TaxID=2862498 RepID=UPI001CA51FBE|nr:beta-ribofuranosylaminobenzene 5'-phosphate synthase family protein [Sphingomonas citricola]MBW6523276.1 hypothetical protein [Sphingomonas citricola]